MSVVNNAFAALIIWSTLSASLSKLIHYLELASARVSAVVVVLMWQASLSLVQRFSSVDEPANSLDSAASQKVISFIRSVAKQYNVCIIERRH